MVSLKDVDVQEFINKTADELRKIPELKPPEWSKFVKTGVSRERPPTQSNWWWIRSASILRKIYLNHVVGVSKLRNLYGGRKNRGHKPEHKHKASGSVIRKILQQLEAAGFIKTEKKKGRVMTKRGRDFLNEIVKSM